MTEKNLTKLNKSSLGDNESTRTAEHFISPPVDIFETEDGLTLVADVPGLDDSSLQVSVDKGILTIEGRAVAGEGNLLYREFSMTGYWRQFQLPDSFAADKAQAKMANGVLSLYLPKTEAAKPRRIDVSVH